MRLKPSKTCQLCWLILGVRLATLALDSAHSQSGTKVFAGYAGSDSCRDCHKDDYDLWQSSHHALAERCLRPATDLPVFSPSRLIQHGAETTIFQFTNGQYQIVTLGFPPAKVLPALSSRTTCGKSARLPGEVIRLLSVPLQDGLGFLPHPLPAIPTTLFADAPAFTRRRNVGFAMFCIGNTNELVPARDTGRPECPCAPRAKETADDVTVWCEPVSAFGSASIDGAFGGSLMLDISFSLSLRPALTLPASKTSSRSSSHRHDVRPLSRQLSTKPLPVSPMPMGYCERNRRFISCQSFHVEQLPMQLHVARHA